MSGEQQKTTFGIVSPGRYQHFKGGVYTVVGVGVHTETDEQFVVYRPFDASEGSEVWVRPYDMFLESVIVNGVRLPRFRRIDS